MSNKAKHTPEPWQIHKDYPDNSLHVWDSEWNLIGKFEHMGVGLTDQIAYANARRSIACVNACKDMENPAEEIAKLREKAAKFDEHLDYHCDHCNEPVFLGQRGKCVVGDEEKTWRFCSNECAHLSVEAENESRGIEP